jgi:hypothetical protein
MSDSTRPTDTEKNKNKLVNKYSHYLTRGLASMIRNLDFNLFSLKTEPELILKLLCCSLIK